MTTKLSGVSPILVTSCHGIAALVADAPVLNSTSRVPLSRCRLQGMRSPVPPAFGLTRRITLRLSALRRRGGSRAGGGEVEFRVGGADVGFGEAEFAADDVGALHQRDAFVIGDAARQP